MPNPLTLPIARLRAAGATVSTVIGHDPGVGTWTYSVTPPAAFIIAHLVRDLSTISPEVRVDASRERVILHASGYRGNAPLPSKAERDRLRGLMAATLHTFADKIGA